MVWPFETSKLACSSNTPPPHPFQTLPQAGDQVSKRVHPWRPFSLKPPQLGCSSPPMVHSYLSHCSDQNTRQEATQGGKRLFWLLVQGDTVYRGGDSRAVSMWRHLVTLHPQSESRESWMVVLHLTISFLLTWALSHRDEPSHTQGRSSLFSLTFLPTRSWTHPEACFHGDPKPISLTMKISHHRKEQDSTIFFLVPPFNEWMGSQPRTTPVCWGRGKMNCFHSFCSLQNKCYNLLFPAWPENKHPWVQ